MGRPKTDAREKLLDAAMEYLWENGIGDLSLRQLAAGIGTSHRMLIYHFGSKEGLLVEVTRAVEHREQQVLAEESFLRPGSDLSPTTEFREVWRYSTKPEFENYLRLFFELYGQALQGRAPEFLDGIVDDWLDPFTQVFIRSGVTKRRARNEARLALAVLRGLFLDLLATGDKAAVNRAMDTFLEFYDAAHPSDVTADAGPAKPRPKRSGSRTRSS